jgi:hypothetical protein
MKVHSALVTACALAFLTIGPASAQDADPADEGLLAKLSVHGFLTQAYARADGGSIYGIPEEGTFDYRTAALQFRYAISPDDDFVVQFSHLRPGRSPFEQAIDDVEIDWVFYQHRFSDAFSLRAGKILIPLGLYNEVRDVGTLFPFYRPTEVVYPFVGFVPETVNGLALAGRLGSGPWSLEAELYGGEWEFRENAAPDFSARTRDAVGAQLWLATPVEGLRFGVGGMRGKLVESIVAPRGQSADEVQVVVSAEGKLGPLKLVAEYIDSDFEFIQYAGYYGQLSWNLTDRVGVHLQHSESDLELDYGPPLRLDLDFSDEDAVSVTYAWRPQVVLKAEYHRFEGRSLEGGAAGVLAPAAEIDYGIASIATSF